MTNDASKTTRTPSSLSRREVIRRAMIAAGAATIVGSNTLLNAACATDTARTPSFGGLFSDEQILWLDEVAETILPATDTPGAKAAGVGPFIALMVQDTDAPTEQSAFLDGMQELEQACQQAHGNGFMEATPAQRLVLLEKLDQEQFDQQAAGPQESAHYFLRIKELTLLGYFTSEIGYKQALRYIETPGRYDPCVPYTEGERTWARHA